MLLICKTLLETIGRLQKKSFAIPGLLSTCGSLKSQLRLLVIFRNKLIFNYLSSAKVIQDFMFQAVARVFKMYFSKKFVETLPPPNYFTHNQSESASSN